MRADVARSKFRSQNVKKTPTADHGVAKSVRHCGAKHVSKSKVYNTDRWEHFWTFRCRFPWQAQRILHRAESEQNVSPKTMGDVKKLCKDAFCVAGAVQETCSSEMFGGLGANFLKGVAVWSIRSSGLLR